MQTVASQLLPCTSPLLPSPSCRRCLKLFSCSCSSVLHSHGLRHCLIFTAPRLLSALPRPPCVSVRSMPRGDQGAAIRLHLLQEEAYTEGGGGECVKVPENEGGERESEGWRSERVRINFHEAITDECQFYRLFVIFHPFIIRQLQCICFFFFCRLREGTKG